MREQEEKSTAVKHPRTLGGADFAPQSIVQCDTCAGNGNELGPLANANQELE